MRKFKMYSLKFVIKTSLFLITFFILNSLFLIQSVYAGLATLSLSPSTGTFNKGCSFSVNVVIDTGGAQVDGADAILIYDPTRFKADKIVNGSIFAEFPGNSIDPQTGKISISSLASMSSPFTGTGTMATVNFTVMADAPVGATQIKFDFDPQNKAKTSDSNIAERGMTTDILNGVTDGSFTVGSGSCVGNTTVTPTRVVTKTPPVGGEEPVPTKKPVLEEAGFFEPTWMLIFFGGGLTILGIMGSTRLGARKI